jgi:hypothetical protein
MRRIALLTTLVALCQAPAIASAKLPFFGLEVDPLHPHVGERITFTMTCYEDAAHTRLWSSCLGAGGRMGWVHPLDDEGRLDRRDWIPVEGRRTSRGATRGTIVLDEPGAYDVLPLWRTWQDRPKGGGFPGAIRIEVGEPLRIAPMAGAALGTVSIAVAVIAWRRRASRPTVTP